MISELMKHICRFMENPARIFRKFNHTRIQRIIPDEPFLKLMIKARLGYKLDLDDPKTFNEKLQWIKLYDHNPIYTEMVDKYEAKKIISSSVGCDFVVPTYGVWDNFKDIDFSTLPDQFVLKTTHDCGGVYICYDKSKFDITAVRKDIEHRLSNNFFWQGREWPYKNVKPRILAEKLLLSQCEPIENNSIMDYKIMCFNGEAKYCLVCSGRHSKEGLHETFFDRFWKPAPFRRNYPTSNISISKPLNYELMINIAEKLSNDIPFLRVDFFEVDGTLFVGELTFFPANGFGAFHPQEWDNRLGELIQLL